MTRPDFPRSIVEFQEWFPTEETCEEYLVNSRWPDGFECPVCGDEEFYYLSTRRVLKCKANAHYTYLTAGTVMHGTRLPLKLWFWAAYLLTTETTGISALQLQRQLGIKRYEVAYNVLQKLRSSMVRPDRDKIGPVVEVDDFYIGGPTTGGKRGRGTQKTPVIIAVQKLNNHAGRVRLRQLEDVSEKSILSFINDDVQPKSTIVTDGFLSYINLRKHGFKHMPILQEDEEGKGLPLAHIMISNLKAWIKGTFHGVSPKHLQAYLNEFTFRFNRRKTPMAAFQTVLGLASNVEGWPTYESLYSGKWAHPNIP